MAGADILCEFNLVTSSIPHAVIFPIVIHTSFYLSHFGWLTSFRLGKTLDAKPAHFPKLKKVLLLVFFSIKLCKHACKGLRTLTTEQCYETVENSKLKKNLKKQTSPEDYHLGLV